MEIRIIKLDNPISNNTNVSGVKNVYMVIENGVEFRIVFHSHIHGSSLGIDGKKGFLYTDQDTNTVRRQVLAISEGCGLRTEIDEIIEGLSPLSVQGVIYAERNKVKKEIIITDERPSCAKGKPVAFIDNQKIELTDTK